MRGLPSGRVSLMVGNGGILHQGRPLEIWSNRRVVRFLLECLLLFLIFFCLCSKASNANIGITANFVFYGKTSILLVMKEICN